MGRSTKILCCLIGASSGFFGNQCFEMALGQNLRTSSNTRRALKKLEIYPSIATYVDDSNPDKAYRDASILQVDASPDRKEIALRFDLSSISSQNNIKSVDLVLECTNGSNRGGGIYKSDRHITNDITWNNRPYKEEGQGLTKLLSSNGPVKNERTYALDVSTLITNGGRLESDISIVILPESDNGADYSANSVKLVVETSQIFAPHSPTPAPSRPTPRPTTGEGLEGEGDVDRDKPFQLMMYWESKYKWQGTHDRKRWCAVCGRGGHNKCYPGYAVRIIECESDNKLQWWIRDGSTFKPYTNQKLCWDYSTNGFELRRCGSSPMQDFEAKPSFNTRGTSRLNRFELVRATMSGCVTQKHHPLGLERVLAEPCDMARKHNTNYWVAQDPPNLDGHDR